MRQHRRLLGVVLGLLPVLGLACVAIGQVPDPGGAADAAKDKPPAAAAPADGAPAPAAAPAAVEPALVMAASVASIDRVAAFLKEAGLGEVPFVSTQFIEGQMPFIGAGGLAGDRPVGVLFYAGQGVDLEKAATFVLPVNPGKAELAGFVQNGAKPVDGRTDLVTLEGMGFRRSDDLFIFGQVPGAVAAVPTDALASAYAAPGGADGGVLARVEFDVAAVKRAMPNEYAAFFATLDAGVKADNAAEQAGAELVAGPMRALTRLTLTLGRSAATAPAAPATPAADGAAAPAGLRLGLVAEPFDLPAAAQGGKFPRPGMPPGTLFRADLAHPPAKALSRVTALFKLLEQEKVFQESSKEQQEHYRALWADLTGLLLGGDAASLGVRLVEGKPVVYWVTRHPAGAAPDPAAGMAAIVAREQALVKLAPGGGNNKPPAMLAHSQYAIAGGLTASRLTAGEGGKPELYLDAVRRPEGDVVLMTISPTDGAFLEPLAALPAEGEATDLLSGWVDLAALMATGVLPGGEDAGIGETAMRELHAAMKGQRLDWSVSPESGAVRLNVDVPAAVLRALAQAAGLTE